MTFTSRQLRVTSMLLVLCTMVFDEGFDAFLPKVVHKGKGPAHSHA